MIRFVDTSAINDEPSCAFYDTVTDVFVEDKGSGLGPICESITDVNALGRYTVYGPSRLRHLVPRGFFDQRIKLEVEVPVNRLQRADDGPSQLVHKQFHEQVVERVTQRAERAGLQA